MIYYPIFKAGNKEYGITCYNGEDSTFSTDIEGNCIGFKNDRIGADILADNTMCECLQIEGNPIDDCWIIRVKDSGKQKNHIGVKFGDYELDLYDIKKTHGHDDSTPFTANFEVVKGNVLYCAGPAEDDGWGGHINYGFNYGGPADEQAVNEALSVFNYNHPKFGFEVQTKLEEAIGHLADIYLHGVKNVVYEQETFLQIIK